MPRGPRTEDPHALYHVFSRGNYRTAIFTDAGAVRSFMQALEATIIRAGWEVYAFAIMPNHFHLLATFPTEIAMREQCDSWLHYTAFQINPLIGSKGKLWQQEPFDHLVRSIEQYDYLRDYIRKNPEKANLRVGEYTYRRFDG